MLVESVFKQHVPFQCKKKLYHLQESDINSIVKYGSGHERNDTKDTRVFSTLGRFGLDVVIAMSWTMHHNAALILHRWEKDGEFGGACYGACLWCASYYPLIFSFHVSSLSPELCCYGPYRRGAEGQAHGSHHTVPCWKQVLLQYRWEAYEWGDSFTQR